MLSFKMMEQKTVNRQSDDDKRFSANPSNSKEYF